MLTNPVVEVPDDTIACWNVANPYKRLVGYFAILDRSGFFAWVKDGSPLLNRRWLHKTLVANGENSILQEIAEGKHGPPALVASGFELKINEFIEAAKKGTISKMKEFAPDTNDGRENCFWCKENTKKVAHFMGNQFYDICSKCKK